MISVTDVVVDVRRYACVAQVRVNFSIAITTSSGTLASLRLISQECGTVSKAFFIIKPDTKQIYSVCFNLILNGFID